VGQTGKVLFRPVLSETSAAAVAAAAASSTTTVPGSASSTPDASATTVAPSTTVATTTATGSSTTAAATPGAATTTTLPPEVAAQITPREQDTPDATVVLPGRGGQTIYQLGPAFALGESAISSASAELQNGEWQVALTLKQGSKGLDAWNNMAKICYDAAYNGGDASQCNGGMAFVLDHKVISAPVPNQSTGGFFSDPTIAITGGQGGFKESEARDLARVLNYGAAPVEMLLTNSSSGIGTCRRR